MADSLRGRQIVLAGGSGGLGTGTAELLAQEGAELTVSYLSHQERASKLAAVARIVRADLLEAQDRSSLLDCAPNLYGLVVFAGNPSRVSDPAQLEAAMRLSYGTNYAGPILLAREAAERMRRTGVPGAIVLFGTMQAVAIFPGSTAYAGAKAALIHAARILAKECRGPRNIRVNVICPGVTTAGMAQASVEAGKYESYLRGEAISRYGSARDIARAVRFLLEPDNYISGQILTIDGGLSL